VLMVVLSASDLALKSTVIFFDRIARGDGAVVDVGDVRQLTS